jgi:7-cyano-7-deazaguanine synthase
MFLAAAAVRAGALGATSIVTGVCQTDYSGYPDCRSSFINAMNGAIGMAWPSLEPAPAIHTPLMNLTKAETVKLARELPGCWGAIAFSVTCYVGTKCGECPACYLRRRGFDEAGEIDPAE